MSSELDQRYWQRGVRIAGVDEVGAGCLAGPVVAAAVVLDPKKIPNGITDSKKLSPKKREELSTQIRATALTWAIGWAQVDEIDTINIFHASKNAMARAVEGLSVTPELVLVDGKFRFPGSIQQLCIVKGDLLSVSIGAASILAKVYRDAWMAQLDEEYPGYGFARNKGYGSVDHRKALGAKGMSAIHRKSFSWTPV